MPNFVSRSKVAHHCAELDLAKNHGEKNKRQARIYLNRATRRQARREIAAALALD